MNIVKSKTHRRIDMNKDENKPDAVPYLVGFVVEGLASTILMPIVFWSAYAFVEWRWDVWSWDTFRQALVASIVVNAIVSPLVWHFGRKMLNNA